ncbi:restriction endonuclease subunit S [Gimesia chilikensis]|uniref:restriction endonuclease subunit S n=1 Tax=Gimesia chilikensis TaxID=2605989 RepID=UPI00118841A8|nr:restriction endonuclease subunit S [Gimesia chilikensis]QDT82454.1 EcoKI restriction-modification system protein HsdS [Gimesia chilikensis]
MSQQTDSNVPAIRFQGFDEGWQENRIGKIVSETKRPIVLEDDQRYELVTVKRRNGGVVSRGYLYGREILVKNYSQLAEGDFLISKRQVVHGATGIVPATLDKAIVSNEYLVAVGNSDISTDFLTLISKRPAMYRKFFLSSYGVVIEKLFFDVEDWKKRTITIPRPSEQSKICSFFKSLDRMIGLLQRKHDKLVTLKQAMLQKMFPQDGATTPEIRFKGFDGVWEEKKLSDICDSFQYGLNASAKKYDGQNKYIRITDIDESSRIFSQANLTTPEVDLLSCQDYLLADGDILFARTGASVGKTYRYKESDGQVFFAGFLIRAKPSNIECADFIFYSTLTRNYDKFVTITSQRSGQPGINAEEYSAFTLHIPLPPEQIRIGSYFRKLDDLIAIHYTQLKKLKNIKSACLEKMFV